MVLRRREGKPLPETVDMKMWREEFKELKLEDHDKMLKKLGLDEEDIAEFNEAETKGRKLEDVFGLNEQAAAEENQKKGRK